MSPSFLLLHWFFLASFSVRSSLIHGLNEDDFPIFHEVPSTNFRCQNQQWAGYYSDPEADCQMFHICVHRQDKVEQFSFMCPNQTVFDQQLLVCVWWDNFDCSSAPTFYSVNEGVFEDLGNDFEVPESRSEGRSFSLDTISSEPDGQSLSEVENDISTFGKSLTPDKDLGSEKTRARSQISNQTLVDSGTTTGVPNVETTQSDVIQITNVKDVQSKHKSSTTKIKADVSSVDEIPLPNKKTVLKTKEKENIKESTQKRLQVSRTSSQSSRQLEEAKKVKNSQRRTTIPPNKLFSRQQSVVPQHKEWESTTVSSTKNEFDKPTISLKHSPPFKSNNKEISTSSRINKNEKVLGTTANLPPTVQTKLSSTFSTTPRKTSRGRISLNNNDLAKPKPLTLRNNEKEKSDQTPIKQSLQDIASQTTSNPKLQSPSRQTSRGKVSFQNRSQLTSQVSKTDKKKNITSSRQFQKQVVPATVSSTKPKSTSPKTNIVQKVKPKLTSQIVLRNEKDKQEKAKVTPSQKSSQIRQGSRFKSPSRSPSSKQVSSRQRLKPTDTTQSSQDKKEKNVPVLQKNRLKSLKKLDQKLDDTTPKPLQILSGISKSDVTINDKDPNIKSSSKKQRPILSVHSTVSPRQRTRTNVNNRAQISASKTVRPRPKFPVSRVSSPVVKNHSGGLTAYGILQELVRNITIIRSKALIDSESNRRNRNIRRNRRVDNPNINILGTPTEQSLSLQESDEGRNAFVDLTNEKVKHEESANKSPWTSAALYQTHKTGYLSEPTRKPEVLKTSQNKLNGCAFGDKNDGSHLGCTQESSSAKETSKLYSNRAFEIPVPKTRSLYSKYSHGSTPEVQNDSSLPHIKQGQETSPRTHTEKHKILNVPGKGIPLTIPRIPLQSNHQNANQHLSPPSLTSSEEEAPVLIVSRADAENNHHNQKKVYLNTIKSDDKKKISQGLFGARLNLELPKQTSIAPASPTLLYSTPSVPKQKLSWADYVNPTKTDAASKIRQTNKKVSSSSYGDVIRNHNYPESSYGSSSTPSYGLY